MDGIESLVAYLADREVTEPGQQTRLARHLGVSPALVWQWLHRKRPIAAAHVRGIEEYTGGNVSRHVIAPDVFGPAPAPNVGEGRAVA